MRLKSLMVCMILTSSLFAQKNEGGLFVEPYLSYENSDQRVDAEPFGGREFDYKGIGIGSRIGFHVYESVFVGGDARYAKYDFNASENNYEEDASGYTWGPTVGLQLPTEFKVRVWWTQILGGELDPDASGGNFDAKFEEADGWRLGVGLAWESLSFNLEYQDLVYDRGRITNLGGLDTNFSSDNVELENKGYVFSVSFPVSI